MPTPAGMQAMCENAGGRYESDGSCTSAALPSWSHRTVVRRGRGLSGHSTGDDDMMGVVDGKRLRAASVSGLRRRAHRASGESVIPGARWSGTSRLSGRLSGRPPAGQASYPALVHRVAACCCSTVPSDPSRDDALCASPILRRQRGIEGLRFRAVDHARAHKKKGVALFVRHPRCGAAQGLARMGARPCSANGYSLFAPNAPTILPAVLYSE